MKGAAMQRAIAGSMLLPTVSAGFKDYVKGEAKSSVVSKATAAAASAATSLSASAASATASIAARPTSIPELFTGFFVRNPPHTLILEACLLAAIAGWIVLHFVGCQQNQVAAKRAFTKVYGILGREFEQVGLKALSDGGAPMSMESNDAFISLAQGRKNVDVCKVTVDMYPRQDLIVALPVRTIYGLYFDGESIADRLTCQFLLPANADVDGFVCGVVAKRVMRYQRKKCWDLQFTKTNDSALLPHQFVTMTETVECLEKVLTKDLQAVVADLGEALEYFVITDQPVTQPRKADAPLTHQRAIRFSVLAGETAATRENVERLVQCALTLCDTLPKAQGKLSAVTTRKLQQAREETYGKIRKQIEEEAKADAPKKPSRKALREKAEKERIAKLSASEQKKALLKERERNMKRGQSKMARAK
ncbi:hypothetical protein BCR37DRAFT_11 [Protomyces lactucae-debilis]|uniref:DUF1682 domain protein n=1 Tax=Protomyces lactucae-debilis TaxID=2754530 RepID=A0A1Y2FVD9_PROLT|nr:uncharacterized protein BCR37DRAFT_11 [Protomyces lactucae-debilis]ORY87537.1 hypothetical protein BCR37DRAFT_11 [Protomyces lactucae-debilis]